MKLSFSSALPSGLVKPKRADFGVGSLIFFLLFGSVWLAITTPFLLAAYVDRSWERISGTVVEVRSSNTDDGQTYTPVVEYMVDGVIYQVVSSISTGSAPSIGTAQEVAYNPAHPADAKVIQGSGFSWFLGLFVAVGVFCLLLGPVLFVRSLRRNKAIEGLLQTGQKTQGVLVDIVDTGGRENSYKIIVAAPNLSGTTEQYASDSLTGVGGLAMADFRNSPIPIDVYIDPANPAHYYVDVSDIPNLTPERIKQLVDHARREHSDQSVTQPPTQPAP